MGFAAAMLRIRKCILSHLYPSPPPTAPISPPSSLHRLPAAAASPFAVEEYLVANCGLSRAKALIKSKKLSHLESPSKPDAVVAFLGGLGLSRADIATVVTNDTLLLCADVEKVLAPRVAKLSELGLSRPQIGRLVLASGEQFRSKCFLRKVELGRRIFGSVDEVLQVKNLPSRQFLRKLEFWLQISGSTNDPLRVVKVNNGTLSIDLKKVAIPNLTLLQQRGVNVSGLPFRTARGLMTKSTERLAKALACTDEFGIRPRSPVFLRALVIFASINSEVLTNIMQLFEKLGWSKNEISLAVSQAPQIFCLGEKRLRRSLEFLTTDVGLEIPYIARKPELILCDTECLLLPRYCLMKFLKAKGFLKHNLSLDIIAKMGKKDFLHTFVHPYEKSVPGLSAVFASSCAGKHQWERLYETDEEK
ncbi:unnamed protein product [Urochloa decumbens]|uniref:Uncharacterized protein n=1 Tax=Urochloa decumbens TaxID=240449 RepID=A0ABC9E6R7_9POAL